MLKIYMVEKASPEFRIKKIDESRSYLLDEIKHNDLTLKKTKRLASISVRLNTCLF